MQQSLLGILAKPALFAQDCDAGTIALLDEQIFPKCDQNSKNRSNNSNNTVQPAQLAHNQG